MQCFRADDGAAVTYPVLVEAEQPHVLCNVYVVTGPLGSPTTEAPASPIAQPTRGAPGEVAETYDVLLVSNACGDVTSSTKLDVVEELTPATILQGDAIGAQDAIVLASGYSALDMSVDEVIADNYSIVIGRGPDQFVPFGCAPIGGVIDDEGGLAFALKPVQVEGEMSAPETNPRTIGSVYLRPTDTGGSGLTIFALPPKD